MPGNLAAMIGPGRPGADILCSAMAAAQMNPQFRNRIESAQPVYKLINSQLGIVTASVAPAENL